MPAKHKFKSLLMLCVLGTGSVLAAPIDSDALAAQFDSQAQTWYYLGFAFSYDPPSSAYFRGRGDQAQAAAQQVRVLGAQAESAQPKSPSAPTALQGVQTTLKPSDSSQPKQLSRGR